MFDLWEDEPVIRVATSDKLDEIQEETPQESESVVYDSVPEGKDMLVRVQNSKVVIVSNLDLSIEHDFEELLGVVQNENDGIKVYEMPLRPLNAFVLRYMLKGFNIEILPDEGKLLAEDANKIPSPIAYIADNGTSVEVITPALSAYRGIVRALNGYPIASGGHRVSIAKAMDLETLSEAEKGVLPKIRFSSAVMDLNRASIDGFDNSMESLKKISVSELNVVKANRQTYKASKKSAKSLSEKMETFGLSTLHDLITWLPRRYIDKSKPQDISDLIPDEPATIIGKVIDSGFLPNGMGVFFIVETSSGRSIKVSFWRQNWLKAKFINGTEVLITGKLTFWNRQPQLNGTSIEDAKEASTLPIVPVYKQSESKGITTNLLVSAIRETFSRLGPIALPEYLDGEGRVDYYDAFKELHLPSSLESHKKVIDSLAYYELVMMQLMIQEAKERSKDRPGLAQSKTSLNLQEKALKTLPFKLTKSQSKAVDALNNKLAGVTPSSTLLNADVGAGKSIVAQLACLRAVESGRQAVLLGPTDILARQLYTTFMKLSESLEKMGESINICFMSGGMKVAEKKKLLASIKSGEVDIVVGTHSVMSAGVEYANLGFVAIDEQQKFGAEQRTRLLNSRNDGHIPDLLMQSATPIPRSTAQVFYGDIDMILLDEKPPGRLPIETVWVEEDPIEVIEQNLHPMWADISDETTRGNQTFIITPMVKDSEKVDAASVERTYSALSKSIFPGLRVAYVHGQMKQDEQKITMEAFRNKEYDILVASTVIEVGVDIPDATRVVILSADRLGASSLHQIRGRVGRNSKPSKCYLVSLGKTENSQLRLTSLVESENGFDVAKADLEVRGEGTMFSDNQSGASEMMFASLSRHGKWVERAKNEALKILASDNRNIALEDSKNHFESEGRLV